MASAPRPKATRRRKVLAKDPHRRMGTTEMRSKFLAALEKTAGDRTGAAGIIGVHYNLVYREMEHDGRFRRNVEIVEAKIRGKAMDRISKNKDWKATAWTLQKKHPDLRDDRHVTPELFALAIEWLLGRFEAVVPKEYLSAMKTEAERVKDEILGAGGISKDLAGEDSEGGGDAVDGADDDAVNDSDDDVIEVGNPGELHPETLTAHPQAQTDPDPPGASDHAPG